ncbi:MAG: hypothetical protein Ta2E_01570 [Mycoplasmoidaceae bacterium]|nr:MAG: hypothetical protein Ta2E_01570 [Mycoplasmoidaceae bacterium]
MKIENGEEYDNWIEAREAKKQRKKDPPDEINDDKRCYQLMEESFKVEEQNDGRTRWHGERKEFSGKRRLYWKEKEKTAGYFGD